MIQMFIYFLKIAYFMEYPIFMKSFDEQVMRYAVYILPFKNKKILWRF